MRAPLVASSGFGGMFFNLRGLRREVVRIWQTRFARNRPRVTRPRRTVDADICLAIGVPVACDRQVVLGAELGPQVAFVPPAVAVEIEEPLAIDVHADVGDAVAVPVAGHRNRL